LISVSSLDLCNAPRASVCEGIGGGGDDQIPQQRFHEVQMKPKRLNMRQGAVTMWK
jgi:hypothetical protein